MSPREEPLDRVLDVNTLARGVGGRENVIYREQYLFVEGRPFRGAFTQRRYRLISFFSVGPDPTSDQGEYEGLRDKALYGRVDTKDR